MYLVQFYITAFNCAKVSYFYFDLFCVVIAFFETCKHSLYLNDKILLLPNFYSYFKPSIESNL